MTTMTARPRGRRPGHDDTRGTIAEAARALFTEHGYDGTSMRAIAREAGVDPALVHHYFATKAQLFTSVVMDTDLAFASRLEEAAAGDPEGLGSRVARAFLEQCERTPLRAAVSAAVGEDGGSSTARRLLCGFMARELFGRIAAAQGHSNAALRGQLAASMLLGLIDGRRAGELGALSCASIRALTEPVGHALQHYLVEPW